MASERRKIRIGDGHLVSWRTSFTFQESATTALAVWTLLYGDIHDTWLPVESESFVRIDHLRTEINDLISRGERDFPVDGCVLPLSTSSESDGGKPLEMQV